MDVNYTQVLMVANISRYVSVEGRKSQEVRFKFIFSNKLPFTFLPYFRFSGFSSFSYLKSEEDTLKGVRKFINFHNSTARNKEKKHFWEYLGV